MPWLALLWLCTEVGYDLSYQTASSLFVDLDPHVFLGDFLVPKEPVDSTVTRLAHAHSSPACVSLYVNTHTWDREVSVFAQKHKLQVERPLLFTTQMVVGQIYVCYSLVRALLLTSGDGEQGVGMREDSQPGHQGGQRERPVI